jgi:hypothetical protein
LGQPGNTFDRKPSVTQTVMQGFPSRTQADGMGLQQPARNSFVVDQLLCLKKS